MRSIPGSPFKQWNRGIRKATGKFVWIAEADDSCEPNLLLRLLDAANQSPSIGLAYCRSDPVDENGVNLDPGFFHRYVSDLHPTRWKSDFFAHGATEVRRYLCNKNTIINASGVLFRREALLSIEGAPENMRMCGDWFTYCKILRHWDVAYVSEPLNFHRQHPARHTTNSYINLVYFREFLQVHEFVARTFGLSEEHRDAAFARFLGEWDRLTVGSHGRIGLKGTAKLAAMTFRSYHRPFECAEIARHLVDNAYKSISNR